MLGRLLNSWSRCGPVSDRLRNQSSLPASSCDCWPNCPAIVPPGLPLRAYHAALQAVMGKHALGPWQKHWRVKVGWPNGWAGRGVSGFLEIRMLRYSTCRQLPEFFGTHPQAAADLAAAGYVRTQCRFECARPVAPWLHPVILDHGQPAPAKGPDSKNSWALISSFPERKDEPVKWMDGIPVWGDPIEASALKQIQRCARTADRAALMADHHKGYAVPIGGVVAYADKISPSGVGYDIACGNKAVRTDAQADDVRQNIARIMDDVFSHLTFGLKTVCGWITNCSTTRLEARSGAAAQRPGLGPAWDGWRREPLRGYPRG